MESINIQNSEFINLNLEPNIIQNITSFSKYTETNINNFLRLMTDPAMQNYKIKNDIRITDILVSFLLIIKNKIINYSKEELVNFLKNTIFQIKNKDLLSEFITAFNILLLFKDDKNINSDESLYFLNFIKALNDLKDKSDKQIIDYKNLLYFINMIQKNQMTLLD